MATALGVAGCASEAPGPGEAEGLEPPSAPLVGEASERRATSQRWFDLTYAADRRFFVEHDLEFREAIGPYAVYRITGPSPRLEGPELLIDIAPDERWAMLCTAQKYFAIDAPEPKTVKAELSRPTDDAPLVTAGMQPVREGECAGPKDDYGEKLPPDADPPSEEEPPSEEPVPVPKMGEPAGMLFDVGWAEAPPPVESLVLLRRVALGIAAPGHNDSHVLPSICCDRHQCGLTLPEPGAEAPK
jgi:hypothetical protein